MYRVEDTVAGDITEVGATPMNNKVRALREQGNVATPSDIKTPDLETMRRCKLSLFMYLFINFCCLVKGLMGVLHVD